MYVRHLLHDVLTEACRQVLVRYNHPVLTDDCTRTLKQRVESSVLLPHSHAPAVR